LANKATLDYAAIAGGRGNEASAMNATVAGGWDNDAGGLCSAVGGGRSNNASGEYSTVIGGRDNTAGGDYSLACGRQAEVAADHHGTFVWADNSMTPFASTGENQFLIRASGGVGINTYSPWTALDVNGDFRASEMITSGPGFGAPKIYIDGPNGTITCSDGTVDFSDDNIVTTGNVGIGITTPESMLDIRDEGSVYFGDPPVAYFATETEGKIALIGDATSYPYVAPVLPTGKNIGIYGIADFGTENWAGWFATKVHIASQLGIGTTDPVEELDIHGSIRADGNATFGPDHTNTGDQTFVAGDGHTATGAWNTVCGGKESTVSGYGNVIAGGYYNSLEGSWGAIPGGIGNAVTAGRHCSMAFGREVYVNDHYRVVFFDSTNSGRFAVNRDDHDGGGISHPIHVGTDATNGNGAHLTAGGDWVSTSSRGAKEAFTPLDAAELLKKISSMPVESWRYENSTERHIGPMAEDFVAAFDVGTLRDDGTRDNKHLSASVVAGVALAAIQEMNRRNSKLETEVAELRDLVEELLTERQ
jgi:hypothetical protein